MDPLFEKFTRCPKCRAFSIRRADLTGKKRKYVCDNCQHEFSMGNTMVQEPIERMDIKQEKKPNKEFLFFYQS
jgi:transposase-like protein